MKFRLVADYEHRAADDTTPAPAHRAVVLSHELSVELSASYANVLHAYLEHVREGAPRPIEAMRALIERLHNLHAGRSEVIRLHAKALQEALRGIGAEHEHDYAMEGRMLAIEMMGLLLERYRADVRALDQ